MSDFLSGLHPTNDKQRQLLAAADQHYARDRRDPAADVAAIDRPDLMAAHHYGDRVVVPAVLRLRTAVAPKLDDDRVLALGAGSVASAIFLILELSQPYTSLLANFPRGSRASDRRSRQISRPAEINVSWRMESTPRSVVARSSRNEAIQRPAHWPLDGFASLVKTVGVE